MRKITSLMFVIASVLTMNATNFYVDPSMADDSGDGLTWATAVKTIPAAYALAAANTGWDNICVKGGTINYTSGWSVGASENYYGSFRGDETSPSERPKVDLDGNGSIDPWEFEFPTVLNSTYNGTALTLPNSNINFNGFTISHTASSTTGLVRTVSCGSAVASFENNTLKNCVLEPSMLTGTIGGVLMKAQGNIKNCLIEKNQVTVTAKYDGGVMPIMEALTNSRISGCVFRNNRVTMDYSTGTSGNGNARGLILSVAGGLTTTVSTHSIVSNCLIYNNEATYVANGNTSMSNGSIVALTAFSSSATTDSIVNCVIANNKTTATKTAGLNVIKAGTAVHWVLNNVLWNNKKDDVVSNLTIGSSLASGMIGNNIMNSGATLTDGTYVANNLTDLSNENADNALAPRFVNPSSVVGYSAVGTVETADWTLAFGSYLAKRGTATTRTIDKMENAFTNPRSVGAYEYMIAPSASPLISWDQNLTSLLSNAGTVTLTATTNADVLFAMPITYTSSNESAVTIDGNILNIVGTGSATVTASQAANTFYNAAADVQQTVNVSEATGLNETPDARLFFTLVDNAIVFNKQASVQIVSYSGSVVKSQQVNKGEVINLPSGAYIVRAITAKGKLIQKIIL